MKNKNILFDFLTFEDKYINGGALYVKTVLLKLIDKKIHLVGICKHYSRINNEILEIANKYNIVIYENIDNLNDIIEKEYIDLFFIGITQRYNYYDLTNIKCKIYGVCHDIGDIVMDNANLLNEGFINKYKLLIKTKRNIKTIVKSYICNFRDKIRRKMIKDRKEYNAYIVKYNYIYFAKLLKNTNFQLITVSEYSKNAIEYYFENIFNEIIVLYPPELIRNLTENVRDFTNLDNKKYFLILSCNRLNKNYVTFYDAFQKYCINHNDAYVVAIGLDDNIDNNILKIKSVNDSELAYLLKNCFALVYPSLNEGFGMPPLEAMKFGKPVVAAFDTSIPEVCGHNALYFNPMYPEDLYNKMNEVSMNYNQLCENSKKRYDEISNLQKNDFDRLINLLTGEQND